MDVLVDAAIGAFDVLVELLRAVLRSPPGQAVLRLAWPLAIEPSLLVLYVLARCVVGPITVRLPRSVRVRAQSVLIAASQLLNRPFVTVPIREVAAAVLVELVQARYGSEARDDLDKFFRLAQGGKKFVQLAVRWGSGRSDGFCNRFFPAALGRGPVVRASSSGDNDGDGEGDGNDSDDEDEEEQGGGTATESVLFCGPDNDEATNLVHLQIAETLLLLSILSYRPDSAILDCLKQDMLPSVKFYSVHTAFSDTDLAIFVARKWKWAVFCFRGTEIETLRDYLTSAIVDESVPFGSEGHDRECGRVRRRYYHSMRVACGESRTRRYVVDPPIPLPGSRLDATAFELVKLLDNDGVKIYATGHSLGGGLAALFGAHIVERYGVTPAAVASFGSPPVAGDETFVRWYRKSIPHSWRFVHGNEFAPMSPPIPFTSSVRLLHVDTVIDVLHLRRPNATSSSNLAVRQPQRTYEEEEAYLDQLARDMKLSSLLYDHNPILSMRLLHLELSRAEHSVSSISLEA